MAVATEVVARFTADISDVQSKMRLASGAFGAVGEAAAFSSKRIAEVGQVMSDVGAKMTVGITLPLGGVALAASNAAMSFETSMTKIIGLVGIASDEVSRMGDSVLTMASRVGKSPDELAAGLFVVTSAGLRGAEAMSTLQQAARAGAAGLGETNDIARAVSGALSAYGSEVLSASAATDAIVATARAGNFETSQFAAAIGRVLPFAQQAGASFQEMGGAVALLTRVNGDAAQSVTQIQALFRAFVVPTQEAKDALSELGLSAEDLRASISEKGLPATLQMLDRRLGGNREQLGRLLGSSEAASAAFQILEADAGTISETFGVVADSSGMTSEAFQAVAGTAQFQVSQAMSELKALLIDLGEQFLPIIKSVMDFMQANLRAFNSLPGPIKTTITVFAGLLAALGPILFIVGKLIVVFSTLLSLMLKTRAVGAMRAAFAGLRGEMATARASMAQTQTRIGMLGTAAKTAKLAIVTSFKAIGAAAKTLVASLGPIGIALGIVAGVMEIFVGKAAGVENAIANLRDELDLTTGALTEAGRTWIATELRTNISNEDLDMLKQYGITIPEFVAALEQGGAAAEEMQGKIDAMVQGQSDSLGDWMGSTRTSANIIGRTLTGMIEHYDAVRESAEDVAAAQVDAAVVVSDAQRGLSEQYRAAAQAKLAADRRMTDSQRALDSALDAGVEAVEALSGAFEKMNAVISNEASRDAAISGIKSLRQALEENGNSLKGNSQKALDNRAAIRNAAQEWMDYAAAAKDPEQAQKRLAKGQDEIRAALKKAGIKPKDSDIFKVFKAQQEESGKTVDEFAKQRDIASRYGNDVGRNFIDGILAELERRKKEVEAAAAAVTSGLTTGGNAGIDATSPSKEAMKVADNFLDGIVVRLAARRDEVAAEMSKAAKMFMDAFMKSFAPKDLGPAASSIVSAIDEIKNAAEDDKELKAWLDANEKAINKLKALANQFDYITGKMDAVRQVFSGLSDLLRTPLGTQSELSRMFEFGQDPSTLARNFTSIASAVRQAYAVLIDPEIVGQKKARANRQRMNTVIKQLRGYVKEMIALQEEYDANLEQMRKNEEQWSIDEKALSDKLSAATKAYDDANRELERIVGERDGLIKGITDGFRSFVNNISGLSKEIVTSTKQTTQELANGVRFIVESSVTETASGASAIAKQLQDRLSQVKDFSRNIQTLMERGLDPALVRDFIQAGVANAGDTVATLAAATDDELRGINDTQAELLKYAQTFATGVGDAYYASAVSSQQKIRDDLKSEVDAAQKALDDARAAFEAERARLEAENVRIEGEVTALATRIEEKIAKLMGSLPAKTAAAAQNSLDAMIAEFNRKFPELKSEFGKLMDKLAKSMERTVTITVRTAQEGTGGATGRSAATAFTPGTVRLATAPTARSVTVAPNAVSVNVNAGAGVDRAALVSQVKAAVDESLESLAREIVAA